MSTPGKERSKADPLAFPQPPSVGAAAPRGPRKGQGVRGGVGGKALLREGAEGVDSGGPGVLETGAGVKEQHPRETTSIVHPGNHSVKPEQIGVKSDPPTRAPPWEKPSSTGGTSDQHPDALPGLHWKKGQEMRFKVPLS